MATLSPSSPLCLSPKLFLPHLPSMSVVQRSNSIPHLDPSLLCLPSIPSLLIFYFYLSSSSFLFLASPPGQNGHPTLCCHTHPLAERVQLPGYSAVESHAMT